MMADAAAPPPFAGLPDLPALRELQTRAQWVAWRYETRPGAKKPTKPPVNPHTGFGASHSDPRTWGSYDEAADLATRRHLPGVGYVMTADDPFTGADLDACRDPATGALAPWAADVLALAETYAEVSPSGTGLRLIWRGKIAETVKADPMHVEIYRDRRFLTITGNHLPGTPDAIQPAPATEAALLARVAGWKAEQQAARAAPAPAAAPGIVHQALPPSRGSDFFRRVNAAALASLPAWVPAIFPGARHQPGTGAFRISSRDLGRDLEEDLSIAPTGIVDFGVHDLGDARDGKRTAVDIVLEFGSHTTAKSAAFWLCDRLGRAPADFGWADAGMGGDAAHGAALARVLIEQHDGTVADPETGEVLDDDPAAASPRLPDDLTRVPGLLGDLVDWMTACADRPCRTLNLGVAITALGALFGRRYASPTNLRTNVYIATLASSGFGKTHPMARVSDLFFTAGLDHLLGGDRIKSDTGLRARLEKAGSVLYLLDEVDGHIRPWLARNAKAYQSNIRDMILQMFSAAGGVYRGDDYGDRATDPIINPNLCLYGTTTHARFWRAFEGGSIDDGFLPRFILLDAGTIRPTSVEPALPLQPPVGLVEALQAASGLSGRANLAGRVPQGTAQPRVAHVPWGPGAQALWREIVAGLDYAQDRAEQADQAIIARIAEHGQKLALIRGIGRDWRSPYVSREDLEWGVAVARASAAMMVASASDMIADTQAQADYLKVRRLVWGAGPRGVTLREVTRRLNGSIERRKLDDIVQLLAQSGDAEWADVHTAGRPRRCLVKGRPE